MYCGSVNVNVEILHGRNLVYYAKALVLDVKKCGNKNYFTDNGEIDI